MTIDYQREDAFSSQESEFIRSYNNKKYLLEKVVSLNIKGTDDIDNDTYLFLLALIDWLITFYHTSNSIYYKIFEDNQIEITHDYLINVIYNDKNFSQNEKNFKHIELLDI